MADRTVKVSDLTGEIIREETDLARLVVEGYGQLQDSQIQLDVRPAEIEGQIPQDEDLIALAYYPPGDTGIRRRFFMERADFERLASGADMQEVLETARSAQAALEPRRRGRGRPRAAQTEKIDYSSAEHAGEPHRGRATEAEQEYVRAHLSAVNKRLTASGLREIDPADPKLASRYGFPETSDAA